MEQLRTDAPIGEARLSSVNRQYAMARRPQGALVEADLAIRERPAPVPGLGEMLARAHDLAADPLLRYRMQASADDDKGLVRVGGGGQS